MRSISTIYYYLQLFVVLILITLVYKIIIIESKVVEIKTIYQSLLDDLCARTHKLSDIFSAPNHRSDILFRNP